MPVCLTGDRRFKSDQDRQNLCGIDVIGNRIGLKIQVLRVRVPDPAPKLSAGLVQ